MSDAEIVELYFARSEQAIAATDAKYGALCFYLARNILAGAEDSEECVNDTYLSLWQLIPPEQPNRFSAFISKITRNLALKKYEYITAAKRNPQAALSLTELEDCVSGNYSVENEVENHRIEQAISEFLWQQDVEKRLVFIRRYWYFDSIAAIAAQSGFSNSKVASMLHQTRQKLRVFLEREGVAL